MYQMPYAQHLHPNHGSAPTQMRVDTHGSPLPYETSQGVFNPIPIPMGYHGCCNYGYVPGYYNPPYPHYPPPPPFYYHGAYPSFPPMYPVHYPPPPHYQMDQPRYEFDKNQMTGHHCCGCPGRQPGTKEDRCVKIEQQEPDIEKLPPKSLVPVEPKSPPYPLVWVPQEYKNSREQRNEPEPKQSEQNSDDLKTKNNVKTTNRNQMEGENNQLPFPIFWIPYKGSEEGKRDYKEPILLGAEGENSMIEPKEGETRGLIDDGPVETKKKICNQKIIPVKQVGENEQRVKEIVREKGDNETKIKSIEVKPVGENWEKGGKEISKGNGEIEKKLLEKPNKSKLPPVCLRVEPLRKKRNGSNGNSRSPSPKRNENKSSTSTENEKNEVRSTERERKAIEVVNETAKEKNKEDGRVEGSKDFKETQERKAEDAKNSEVTNMLDKTDEGINMSEKSEKGETNMLEKVVKENCESETKVGRKLSEVEAAIKIQSAYRGFEMRRWEQLKKLKQIGEIREKMAEIKLRVKALEPSADNISFDKQRVVIGETIMSLLLKLDTIQGLHPTVREIRKSVAKELASLQEQLDSMGNNSSELSSVEHMEDPAGGEKKAEVDHESSVEVASQAIVSEVVEKEISGEAKDEADPVSSVGELKDKEGAKEDSSEMMMTEINDEKPELNDGFGSEVKVSSCVGDSSTDQPSVNEDEHNEQISVEMCEELRDPGFEIPSTDMIEITEAIANTEESQGSLDECKDNSLPGNLEDTINSEMGIESGDCHRVDEEKISGEVQGLDDFVKSFNAKEDCIEKHETGVQVQEDREGDGAKIVTDISFESDAEQDQPHPEPLEKHAVEDSKSEEVHGEGETSELVEMKGSEKELNVALKIENVGKNENVEPIETVKVHGEADPPKPEEMGGSELDMAPTEENLESPENKYVVEIENVENYKNVESIETVDFEKPVENDIKLAEENEKLREMVAKLVEAGKEQLSVISSLSGRVKDLEMKLVRKKKPKMRRMRVGSSCTKPSDPSVKERVKGVVV